MSEHNAEMGERRRRREEERRRLAGESVGPAEPSTTPPVPTTLSRRELRERAAAQSGPVAAATPPASRPASPPASPPASRPASPPVSAPAPRSAAPVSQPVPRAVPAVEEVRPSRRDLRERAADLHPQPGVARESAPSGSAPLAAQTPRPTAFVARPAVQAPPPGSVSAAPAAPVQPSPQAASPLSPQARAAAIRAQAARAQAEREEAARLQVERAHTQRAQQRPAVQPPSGIWSQASTQAQPTDAVTYRAAQVPEASEERPTGPRPFVGPARPAFPAAPAAAVNPAPATQATQRFAAAPPDGHRPGQEPPRPAQPAPSAVPTSWSSTPEHDPATAVRRVVLPPMEAAHEPIALPTAQQAPAAAPERSNGWSPAGGYGSAQRANGAPAGPVQVPGIAPDSPYQPVISPAPPARPNGAAPSGAAANAPQAVPVRQAAFGPVGQAATGQRFDPVGSADRDAAATAVQAFPRVEAAGPTFARGADAPVSVVPPFARAGVDEAAAAEPETELPRWGSLGWTPAPTSTPAPSPASASATSAATAGFGSQRGFGAVSAFGSATGSGALVDAEADTGTTAEAGTPSPSRRSDHEPAADGEDESTHHPYTWLHMIVLVVVAFILGMLIFMVLMQDNSSDAGATGAQAHPHQVALVADAGPGA